MTGEMAGCRTSWFCSICTRSTKTYQLVPLDRPTNLMLPAGWRKNAGRAVCELHEEAKQKKAA